MSHILFGDFYLNEIESSIMKDLQSRWLQKGILIMFDHELLFNKELCAMLDEHGITGKKRFCITTIIQKYNSDDLLFPYDKYSSVELFPNGDDRTYFEKVCLDNLLVLQEVILDIKEMFKFKELRIFVTEGYDTEFVIKKCSVQEMINDINSQVVRSFILESVIYEIT